MPGVTVKLVERLTQSIRSAAGFNPNVQAAPACILWPDRERQWESVLSRLLEALPELFVLGDYLPDKRTGPAIWLRCILAGTIGTTQLPEGSIPLLYLPGVGRQDLRPVESCPDHLKPLAELQYRGVIWSQVNAKDWTILAFLKSDQGGLGLDVAQDNDTKDAMQLALYCLLDEEVGQMRGKRLDRDFFNTLITGDPVRELLQWLDQGEAFTSKRATNEWSAFVSVCESRFDFNPQAHGPLEGAARLAAGQGSWQAVWERFCEAPMRYPNIPRLIRQSRPPAGELFDDAASAGGWPQWNDEQESRLRGDLTSLTETTSDVARARLQRLEEEHRGRRSLVWTELGESPLALALEHLSILADITRTKLAGNSAEELASAYRDKGWQGDNAVMMALAHVEKPGDYMAVTAAIRQIYAPWAEDEARHLQKLVDGAMYPGGTIEDAPAISYQAGECVLFVDGLRFDCAMRLAELLQIAGCDVEKQATWAALPTVTATGKPAVAPVRKKIVGQDANVNFEPGVAATGQSLKGGYHLNKLLKDDGWQLLGPNDNGDALGNAWCAFGDIDNEGHDHGWKLGKRLEGLLCEIRERILALLGAGWRRVRVVTDHGWLLLPGGLPKIELPAVLTESRGGRSAVVKSDVVTEERFYPWFWNPKLEFALADGISCYRHGFEYAHGGLSLQECVTLELRVAEGVGTSKSAAVEFSEILWKGLRCVVVVDGPVDGLIVDIRMQPGVASSSVVFVPRPLTEGMASVVVENEDFEGKEAILVLLDENSQVIAQAPTLIGGEST